MKLWGLKALLLQKRKFFMKIFESTVQHKSACVLQKKNSGTSKVVREPQLKNSIFYSMCSTSYQVALKFPSTFFHLMHWGVGRPRQREMI